MENHADLDPQIVIGFFVRNGLQHLLDLRGQIILQGLPARADNIRFVDNRNGIRDRPSNIESRRLGLRFKPSQRFKRNALVREGQDELVPVAAFWNDILLREDLYFSVCNALGSVLDAERLKLNSKKSTQRVGVLRIIPEEIKVDAPAATGAARDRRITEIKKVVVYLGTDKNHLLPSDLRLVVVEIKHRDLGRA